MVYFRNFFECGEYPSRHSVFVGASWTSPTPSEDRWRQAKRSKNLWLLEALVERLFFACLLTTWIQSCIFGRNLSSIYPRNIWLCATSLNVFQWHLFFSWGFRWMVQHQQMFGWRRSSQASSRCSQALPPPTSQIRRGEITTAKERNEHLRRTHQNAEGVVSH